MVSRHTHFLVRAVLLSSTAPPMHPCSPSYRTCSYSRVVCVPGPHMSVGDGVGTEVGCGVGMAVGCGVGKADGWGVGTADGWGVGTELGCGVGSGELG